MCKKVNTLHSKLDKKTFSLALSIIDEYDAVFEISWTDILFIWVVIFFKKEVNVTFNLDYRVNKIWIDLDKKKTGNIFMSVYLIRRFLDIGLCMSEADGRDDKIDINTYTSSVSKYKQYIKLRN